MFTAFNIYHSCLPFHIFFWLSVVLLLFFNYYYVILYCFHLLSNFNKMIKIPQITDYPPEYLEFSIKDRDILRLFIVDTGLYRRLQFGYRKRSGPCKLRVKLPLVEERLDLIVRPELLSFTVVREYLDVLKPIIKS